MKIFRYAWLFVVSFCFVHAQLLTPEALAELLKRLPAADTNGDGVLTESEARAYYEQMRARRAPPTADSGPAPTHADAAYGPHARNVLDFWQAPGATAEQPAPVVVFIHGGGFLAGDKRGVRRTAAIRESLAAGVSFASINYRYLSAETPLQDVLRDSARAIQFLRSRAGAWHIDKTRIAAHGESAGAGTSLWLAAHADLADPKNADAVLRESSRIACAGLQSPQFSYDWFRWNDVFGADVVRRFGEVYNSPALYGLATPDELRGPAGAKVRADCDMVGLMTRDTPPIFIHAALPDLALETPNQFLHHPKHAQLIYERCRELGIPVVANIRALRITPPADGPQTWRDFVFQHLGVKHP